MNMAIESDPFSEPAAPFGVGLQSLENRQAIGAA